MRYQKHFNANKAKGKWTHDEEQILLRAIAANGDRDWVATARLLPGRTGLGYTLVCDCAHVVRLAANQCLQRYRGLKASTRVWTADEDETLIRAVNLYGNEWQKVSQHVEGRSDRQCRERYTDVLNPKVWKL